MQLFVGLNSHRGSIKRYAFDLLELPVSASLPKRRTLREMRESKPELKFSLRLHPDVAMKGEAHEDMTRAVDAAEVLQAVAIVIPTGPRFTPTERNRVQLKKMVEALSAEGRQVAWEPRGVWSPNEAVKWAEDVGALLVRDLTREAPPPSAVIYTRLLPFGMGARVSQSAVEMLANRLESAETAYVVVQGEGAKGTRAQLRDWFELEDE